MSIPDHKEMGSFDIVYKRSELSPKEADEILIEAELIKLCHEIISQFYSELRNQQIVIGSTLFLDLILNECEIKQ